LRCDKRISIPHFQPTKIKNIMAEWSFLQNQFDNSTKESYVLMLILGSDHLSKLKVQNSDPEIDALYQRTDPLTNHFQRAYTIWKNAIGTRKGATLKVDQMLNELSGLRIKQWDISVQGHYLEGTPDYMAILPNRRGPFQSGGIDERIIAVNGLADRLLNYPALAATQAAVDAFLNQLKAARDDQQGKEQLIAQGSDDLEQARLKLAVMMYGNLGVLMDKYRETPDYINNYWEVSLMQARRPSVREFDGDVAPEATVNITGVVGPNAKVMLNNTGHAELRFCLATEAGTACATGVTVQPGQAAQVMRADLGDAAASKLNVTNLSVDAQGTYNVEVVG